MSDFIGAILGANMLLFFSALIFARSILQSSTSKFGESAIAFAKNPDDYCAVQAAELVLLARQMRVRRHVSLAAVLALTSGGSGFLYNLDNFSSMWDGQAGNIALGVCLSFFVALISFIVMLWFNPNNTATNFS